MELLWIDYTKKNGTSRYILFLLLGKRSGKLCGLETDKIPDAYRKKIVNTLTSLSLESRIRWLRQNCPILMRSAYKELVAERATIRTRYPIDKSKIV